MKKYTHMLVICLIAWQLSGCDQTYARTTKARPEASVKHVLMMAMICNIAENDYIVPDLENASVPLWKSQLEDGTFEDRIAKDMPARSSLRSGRNAVGEDIRTLHNNEELFILVNSGNREVVLLRKEDFNVAIEELSTIQPSNK